MPCYCVFRHFRLFFVLTFGIRNQINIVKWCRLFGVKCSKIILDKQSSNLRKHLWTITWHKCIALSRPSVGHSQLYTGVIGIPSAQRLRLTTFYVFAMSEGSDKTVRMHRLVWAFATRLCNTNQSFVSRIIYGDWSPIFSRLNWT